MAGSREAGSSVAGGKNVCEHTPLLAGDGIDPTANPSISKVIAGTAAGADDDDDDKPLPTLQIILLCYARFVEPISFFCIFPFVNQMVQENGNVADADVGFYSGVIESLFSLTQMAVMIFWGEASDRIGRKPVLVFSLAGVTAATAIFGMARTIWQMVLFRCLAGIFAGTIVTIRTMISEHSTAKTQTRAFSWFAFTGNLGILVGPLVGGALTDPVHQYPSLFKNVQFFKDYPYALPNFAVGAICLSCVIITALFVDETLVKKPSGGGSELGATTHPSLLSTWELLRSPGVTMALFVYGYVMLLTFAFTAIIPVFWFTPVELGGYGLNPLHISIFMGINGLGQSIWTLLVFPPLQRRIGTTGVLRVCAVAGPFVYALCPLFNVLRRVGDERAETVFWAALPASLLLGCGLCLAFPAIQLMLNDVAPSPQTVGTLNAIALTEMSGIRAVSPALFTSLFAVGARTQWLWGYSIWLVMIIMATAYTVVSRYIPDYDEMRRARGQEQRGDGRPSSSVRVIRGRAPKLCIKTCANPAT